MRNPMTLRTQMLKNAPRSAAIKEGQSLESWQEAARAKLNKVLARITPLELPKAVSVKRRVLLKAAQSNLERTAKVLNFLIDIHLLT